MTVHTLQQEQVLPITLEQAWEFFSSPANLNELTPPELKFRILTKDLGRMFPGQMIAYKIRILPLVWVSWVTEITHVEEGYSFVDEQRFGPYKLWHHRHTFEAVSGGVLMKDRVDYALYGWIFADIIHAAYLGNQLESIFSYRREILEKKFGKGGV
jgi:ligand-binding SRPBCC domain-containing protein